MRSRGVAFFLFLCLGTLAVFGQTSPSSSTPGYGSIVEIAKDSSITLYLVGDIRIEGKVVTVTPSAIMLTEVKAYKLLFPSPDLPRYVNINVYGQPDLIVPYSNVLYYTYPKK